MRDAEPHTEPAPAGSEFIARDATGRQMLAALLRHAERAMRIEEIPEASRRRVINTMIYGHPDPNAQAVFVCPRCGKPSWHPEDKSQGYCGGLHGCAWWTGDAHLSLPDGRARGDVPAAREEQP